MIYNIYKKENKMEVINIADTIEGNGKTLRQNNALIDHKIPIDTLVEVKYDTWFGDGACKKVHARLFVFEHTRDCDGTPLYSLSERRKSDINPTFRSMFSDINENLAISVVDKVDVTGICEAGMTIIEVTPGMEEGKHCLEWGEVVI
jgi:hypothetical protein